LIVGRFTWGTASDKIDIWTADTSLNLTVASTRTTVTNYDQTLFDTILIGSKASGTDLHLFDEIRFGATQADVLPVPEPSSAAGFSLGSGVSPSAG